MARNIKRGLGDQCKGSITTKHANHHRRSQTTLEDTSPSPDNLQEASLHQQGQDSVQIAPVMDFNIIQLQDDLKKMINSLNLLISNQQASRMMYAPMQVLVPQYYTKF